MSKVFNPKDYSILRILFSEPLLLISIYLIEAVPDLQLSFCLRFDVEEYLATTTGITYILNFFILTEYPDRNLEV